MIMEKNRIQCDIVIIIIITIFIIYKKEKLPILNYIHFSNNHLKSESMDEKYQKWVFIGTGSPQT